MSAKNPETTIVSRNINRLVIRKASLILTLHLDFALKIQEKGLCLFIYFLSKGCMLQILVVSLFIFQGFIIMYRHDCVERNKYLRISN